MAINIHLIFVYTLAALIFPSTKISGPILSLQKHPHTITPSECFTVGAKQSCLYFSSHLLQTSLWASFLNIRYLDSSLKTTLSHSSFQFFILLHHSKRIFATL